MSTTGPPYKNWPNISQLQNPYLRLAAATAEDEETLAILGQITDPVLFSDIPATEGPVPLSAMREYATQRGMRENDPADAETEAVRLFSNGACCHFSVPTFTFVDPNLWSRDSIWESDLILPAQLRYDAVAAQVGGIVSHQDSQFVVVELMQTRNGPDDDPDTYGCIMLAPASFIVIDR